MHYRTRRTLETLRYRARVTLCALLALYSALCATFLATELLLRGYDYKLTLALALTTLCAICLLYCAYIPRYSPHVIRASRAIAAKHDREYFARYRNPLPSVIYMHTYNAGPDLSLNGDPHY